MNFIEWFICVLGVGVILWIAAKGVVWDRKLVKQLIISIIGLLIFCICVLAFPIFIELTWNEDIGAMEQYNRDLNAARNAYERQKLIKRREEAMREMFHIGFD